MKWKMIFAALALSTVFLADAARGGFGGRGFGGGGFRGGSFGGFHGGFGGFGGYRGFGGGFAPSYGRGFYGGFGGYARPAGVSTFAAARPATSLGTRAYAHVAGLGGTHAGLAETHAGLASTHAGLAGTHAGIAGAHAGMAGAHAGTARANIAHNALARTAQSHLSLSHPLKSDAHRTPNRMREQGDLMRRGFNGYNLNHLYFNNFPFFIGFFPFWFYSLYGYYPPIYYDFYDLTGYYPEPIDDYDLYLSGGLPLPVDESQYTEPTAYGEEGAPQDLASCKNDCTQDCSSQCLQAGQLTESQCRTECAKSCDQECHSQGQGNNLEATAAPEITEVPENNNNEEVVYVY